MTKKKASKKTYKKVDTYQLITDVVLKKLEEGVVPWSKPWKMLNTGCGFESAQKNILTKKSYQGFNVMMTEMQMFDSDWWLTYNQAKQLGGQVKKGEKGTPIIYWQVIELKEVDEKTGKKKKIPMLKHFTIFNLDQVEGVEPPAVAEAPVEEVEEFISIELAEQIVKEFKQCPPISHGGDRACYSPPLDKIKIPKKTQFKTNEEYYSTLFHELIHSTGHVTRLNRKGVTDHNFFGSHEYSKEELVAEFGNCFLCSECGIDNTINNSAAYIKQWSEALKEDKKLIIQASGQAKKAARYVMGVQADYEKEEKVKKKVTKKKAKKKKFGKSA